MIAALRDAAVLTAAQASVADRVLADECAAREHLVIALSGAHAYGFPSPDSDLDLKGVHVEPTATLVGLTPPALAASRVGFVDGVEIDYSSNEIGGVIAGLLAGNGNYFERILGRLQCVAAPPELADLAALTRAAISRRVHRHYAGFAKNQLDAVGDGTTPAPAKRVLYVLRTALTGIHALRTGEIIADVSTLIDDHGLGHVRELIAAKRAGERAPLDPTEVQRWRATLERLLADLDRARETSALPDEPPNRADLEAWLLALRRARF